MKKTIIIQTVAVFFMLTLSTTMTAVAVAGNLHNEAGQRQNLQSLVDDFVDNLQNDVRINHIFLANNSQDIHSRLMAVLCETQQFDCHQTQTTSSNNARRLPLSPADITIVLQHLDATASKHYLSNRVITQVAERLTAETHYGRIDVPLASL